MPLQKKINFITFNSNSIFNFFSAPDLVYIIHSFNTSLSQLHSEM